MLRVCVVYVCLFLCVRVCRGIFGSCRAYFQTVTGRSSQVYTNVCTCVCNVEDKLLFSLVQCVCVCVGGGERDRLKMPLNQ